MKTLINPPQLNINKVLYRERSMPVHVRLEQRIVWNLLLVLEAAGFSPISVDDGDSETRASSKKSAMELLFNLDDAYLLLQHKDEKKGRKVWVRFVFGNGIDVISDYSAVNWNGFEGIMDSFDPEKYA